MIRALTIAASLAFAALGLAGVAVAARADGGPADRPVGPGAHRTDARPAAASHSADDRGTAAGE